MPVLATAVSVSPEIAVWVGGRLVELGELVRVGTIDVTDGRGLVVEVRRGVFVGAMVGVRVGGGMVGTVWYSLPA